MRRKLIAGNWKMNGSQQANTALLEALLPAVTDAQAEVAVIPPFVYLAQVAELIRGSKLQLGAQNLAAATGAGAYTGEVSGDMLTDLGCRLVLVGHSERRSLYGETDAVVAAKVQAALAAQLVPVVCIGETEQERADGETESVVERQLRAALDGVAGRELVIAYEPVWAIGTGNTATPEQAQAVHAKVRSVLGDVLGEAGQATRILYGGSMNAGNAAALMAQPDIDGGLVGGASLKAQDFATICLAATD